jgi:hypothetical protein
VTSRITQRDGATGRHAPGSRTLLYPGDPGPHRVSVACRNPGLLDDSGLASASRPRIARGPQASGRQPGHPGARILEPGGIRAFRTGSRSTPCAVTLDRLRRQGDGLRAAGTTNADASAPRRSRKTLSAACAVKPADYPAGAAGHAAGADQRDRCDHGR